MPVRQNVLYIYDTSTPGCCRLNNPFPRRRQLVAKTRADISGQLKFSSSEGGEASFGEARNLFFVLSGSVSVARPLAAPSVWPFQASPLPLLCTLIVSYVLAHCLSCAHLAVWGGGCLCHGAQLLYYFADEGGGGPALGCIAVGACEGFLLPADEAVGAGGAPGAPPRYPHRPTPSVPFQKPGFL